MNPHIPACMPHVLGALCSAYAWLVVLHACIIGSRVFSHLTSCMIGSIPCVSAHAQLMECIGLVLWIEWSSCSFCIQIVVAHVFPWSLYLPRRWCARLSCACVLGRRHHTLHFFSWQNAVAESTSSNVLLLSSSLSYCCNSSVWCYWLTVCCHF